MTRRVFDGLFFWVGIGAIQTAIEGFDESENAQALQTPAKGRAPVLGQSRVAYANAA
jgi:hypothetical protein